MPEQTDMELVRDYVSRGGEQAFALLVQRHVNLVYSVALRHLGVPAQAEEVTQAVFVVLARKAAKLRPDTILEGWLYETARFTSLSFRRAERRRQRREQQAYMESQLHNSSPEAAWEQLAPLLDEALSKLGKSDRDAIVLRFFKDKSVREVAAALQTNESATQRRILRAVEKLRRFFVGRGVQASGPVLIATISARAMQTAPGSLAAAATSLGLTKGASASGSTLSLIKSALNVMAWSQAKSVILFTLGTLLAAGTTTSLLIQTRAASPTSISLPRSGWTYAGYSSPENTIRTLAWAAARTNGAALFGALTPACQEEFRQYVAQTQPGKTAEQFFLQRAVAGIASVSRMRLEPQSLWTNCVLLHLTIHGEHSGDMWLKMQKIEDDWRIDDLDAKGKNGRTGLPHPNAEYGGIGLGVKMDAQTHELLVTEVWSNSPAVQAGLAPGFIVRKIDGSSIAGKTLAECIFLTRGRVGTSVVLEVFDPKLHQTNTVALLRHPLN